MRKKFSFVLQYTILVFALLQCLMLVFIILIIAIYKYLFFNQNFYYYLNPDPSKKVVVSGLLRRRFKRFLHWTPAPRSRSPGGHQLHYRQMAFPSSVPSPSLYTSPALSTSKGVLLHAKWISMVGWAPVQQDVELRLQKDS